MAESEAAPLLGPSSSPLSSTVAGTFGGGGGSASTQSLKGYSQPPPSLSSSQHHQKTSFHTSWRARVVVAGGPLLGLSTALLLLLAVTTQAWQTQRGLGVQTVAEWGLWQLCGREGVPPDYDLPPHTRFSSGLLGSGAEPAAAAAAAAAAAPAAAAGARECYGYGDTEALSRLGFRLDSKATSMLSATGAFSVLALFSGLAAAGILLLSHVRGRILHRKLGLVAACNSAFCTFIAICIFGSFHGTNYGPGPAGVLGWSFALALLGLGTAVGAAVCAAFDLRILGDGPRPKSSLLPHRAPGTATAPMDTASLVAGMAAIAHLTLAMLAGSAPGGFFGYNQVVYFVLVTALTGDLNQGLDWVACALVSFSIVLDIVVASVFAGDIVGGGEDGDRFGLAVSLLSLCGKPVSLALIARVFWRRQNPQDLLIATVPPPSAPPPAISTALTTSPSSSITTIAAAAITPAIGQGAQQRPQRPQQPQPQQPQQPQQQQDQADKSGGATEASSSTVPSKRVKKRRKKKADRVGAGDGPNTDGRTLEQALAEAGPDPAALQGSNNSAAAVVSKKLKEGENVGNGESGGATHQAAVSHDGVVIAQEEGNNVGHSSTLSFSSCAPDKEKNKAIQDSTDSAIADVTPISVNASLPPPEAAQTTPKVQPPPPAKEAKRIEAVEKATLGVVTTKVMDEAAAANLDDVTSINGTKSDIVADDELFGAGGDMFASAPSTSGVTSGTKRKARHARIARREAIKQEATDEVAPLDAVVAVPPASRRQRRSRTRSVSPQRRRSSDGAPGGVRSSSVERMGGREGGARVVEEGHADTTTAATTTAAGGGLRRSLSSSSLRMEPGGDAATFADTSITTTKIITGGRPRSNSVGRSRSGSLITNFRSSSSGRGSGEGREGKDERGEGEAIEDGGNLRLRSSSTTSLSGRPRSGSTRSRSGSTRSRSGSLRHTDIDTSLDDGGFPCAKCGRIFSDMIICEMHALRCDGTRE